MIIRRETAPNLPRVLLVVLSIAVIRHLVEFAIRVGQPTHVPAFHWALLAASEMFLIAVAVHRPWLFYVRTFRLPGVALTAVTAMLLIPFPPIVHAYGDRVASDMVLGLACGLAAMGAIFWFSLAPTPPPAAAATNEGSRLATWMIVGLALAILPIWIATIGSLPIAQLITGSATGVDIAAARSQALKEIGSAPLRLLIGAIRNLYLFLATGWLIADWRMSERGSRVRFLRGLAAASVVGLAAFYALVTTERALLGHLTVIVIVAMVTAAGGQMTSRTMGLAVGGALSFPFLFALLNLGSGAFGGAINSIQRRIFFVPADVMTLHFVAFPARNDFLHGASIPKVSRLWGAETFDLSRFIFESFFGRNDAFQGNANSSFLAVGWANGGVIGVVIWSLIAAAALLWMERLISRLPMRWSAALRGLAVVQALLFTSSDIFRSLLGFAPGFLDLVVIVMVVTFFHERVVVRADLALASRPHFFHRNRLHLEPERTR